MNPNANTVAAVMHPQQHQPHHHHNHFDNPPVQLQSPAAVATSSTPFNATATGSATSATSLHITSCRICGTRTELRRCASCKTAFYCSQTHQESDWPNHRAECRTIVQLNELRRQQQSAHGSEPTAAATSSSVEPTAFDVAAAQMQHDRQQQLMQQRLQQQQQQEQLLLAQRLKTEQSRRDDEKRERDSRNFSAENTMRLGEMSAQSPVQGLSNQHDDDVCRLIINDMNKYGLSVIDDFLGRSTGLEILREVDNMYGAGVFKNGQLVSNTSAGPHDQQTIRGDKITWVKGTEPTCTHIGFLINQIDNLVMAANRMRDNGTLGQYRIRERTAAMVACYPGSGSHYVMHVDNPNHDGRIITAIYYLNVDWDSSKYGGRLTIHPKPGNTQATIDPAFDRILFFWSDRRNPHEVQPAHRTRYAITVWYFDADEREAALNRSRQQQQQQQQQQQPLSNPQLAASSVS